MDGTMLWFNIDKGHGVIHTADDERIVVAESGFAPGHTPTGRCKGLPVTFERRVEGGDARAVDVAFSPEASRRRARLRHSRRSTGS